MSASSRSAIESASDHVPVVTIVVPALNEERALPGVLRGLMERARERHWQVIVVDDCSGDATAAVAKVWGAEVISHKRRRGYGAAIKTGIEAARTPWIATMDADGQHTIDALDLVLSTLGSSDMVVGARSGLRQSTLWRMPGKWLLGKLATFIAARPIPDLNSGLRACRTDLVKRYLHLCPDGFSFSTTVSLAFLNRGLTVTYVPISVHPSDTASSVTPLTGLQTVLLVLRLATLFEPLRLFLGASVVFFAAGVIYAIPYAIAGRGISIGAALLVFTAIQLFFSGLIADQISNLRKERFE